MRRGPNPTPVDYPLDCCNWGAYVRFHGSAGQVRALGVCVGVRGCRGCAGRAVRGPELPPRPPTPTCSFAVHWRPRRGGDAALCAVRQALGCHRARLLVCAQQHRQRRPPFLHRRRARPGGRPARGGGVRRLRGGGGAGRGARGARVSTASVSECKTLRGEGLAAHAGCARAPPPARPRLNPKRSPSSHPPTHHPPAPPTCCGPHSRPATAPRRSAERSPARARPPPPPSIRLPDPPTHPPHAIRKARVGG